MTRLIPFLVAVVALCPGSAQAALPAKPQDVLPYLEQVYKKGDIQAYSNLLSSDYRYVMEDLGKSWDATQEVKGTRRLFERASAQISFSGDTSIKPSSQPGTWVIDDVVGDLKVTQKKDGRVFRTQNTYSFVIRDENGIFRIAQWRQKLTR